MLQTTISMTQSKFRHGKTHQRFFQDVYVFKWNSTKKTPRKTMLPAEIKTSRSLDSYLHSWLLGGVEPHFNNHWGLGKLSFERVFFSVWFKNNLKYWSKTQGPPRNPVSGNDNCHMKNHAMAPSGVVGDLVPPRFIQQKDIKSSTKMEKKTEAEASMAGSSGMW